MTQRTHYTVLRSQISSKAYKQFVNQDLSEYDGVWFVNEQKTQVETWGVSKQIKLALMNNEFFRYFFPQQQLQVGYDDDQVKPEDHTSSLWLKLPSSLLTD